MGGNDRPLLSPVRFEFSYVGDAQPILSQERNRRRLLDQMTIARASRHSSIHSRAYRKNGRFAVRPVMHPCTWSNVSSGASLRIASGETLSLAIRGRNQSQLLSPTSAGTSGQPGFLKSESNVKTRKVASGLQLLS